ncbi:MAG: hypothetical protein PHW74_10225 [Desulfobacca sp.]|nr:hypothetical protein [Desulfobacca sp.]
MKHLLSVSMQVPRARAEVFGFFAEANNLETITPPELHFHIVSPQTIIIQKDTYTNTVCGFSA